MATQRRQSRGTLLGAAWEVAARYRAHNAYGSESRACRALQRRCPGFTARQCQNVFRRAVVLYDEAVALVAQHADALWRQMDVAADWCLDLGDLVDELRRRCPRFPVWVYRVALGWVFFWHHLK